MLRIYVSSTIPDARGKVKKRQFEALGLKSKLGAVSVVDCYTINAKLDKKQLEKVNSLLANPLSQRADVSQPLIRKFSFAIEIGYLPGVTDNIGHTAKETIQEGARLKFKPDGNVYSSQVFFITLNDNRKRPSEALVKEGRLIKASKADILKIANSLYNPLIQRATITAYDDFIIQNGLPLVLPKVKLKSSNKVSKIDLNVSDEELAKIGKQGILNSDGTTRRGPLSMDVDYLKTIRDYFNKLKRSPTDVELEALAQTWSEHCKHTIFSDPLDDIKDGLYKTYIKAATKAVRKQKGRKDFCVSVFSDNSGAIKFNNDYLITHKVETHNTPSALDPFGGAITGIVGVNRDALGFGLGAKPVANFYGFCLAEPGDKTKLFRDKELKNPMLSARRIMDGVIAGINSGGNQSGIPTNSGFMFFDPRYRGKPLVFAGTVGLIPKKSNGRLSYEKQAKPGDYIVVVGGRVGQDGIHGATFSSEGLDTHSPATAVQIGDPITQKKLSDALAKEARDLKLYNSITDNGAGGLSSSIGEMAKESNGCVVYLDKVPLKYPGLAPWQIWISESQERMTLAVPKNKYKKFLELMEKRGVEAAIIGEFTNSGQCLVKFQNKTVMDIDMDFLHDGRPIKHLKTKKPKTVITKRITVPKTFNFSLLTLNLLSSPSIASTEFINRQYDHEVQGSSVLKPLQGRGAVNAEATVTRPLLSSKKGLVLSYGLNPLLSEIDPYNMAAAAIDSAIRSAVAAGANIDELALLDNFCWCSSTEPERLWQLKQAAKACFDFAVAFSTPFISGKDSMFNDFKGFNSKGEPVKISIPPTLLISTMAVIPDIEKSVSLDVKLNGDLLYVLGETNNEMLGSEFGQQMMKLHDSKIPKVNAEKNYQLYQNFYKASQENMVASAISIGRGGLAVALSKTLMAGGLGGEIDLDSLPGNWKENYQALFSESQGRILVSIDPKKSAAFELLLAGNTFAKIGKVTTKPQMTIKDKTSKTIVSLNLNQLLKSYKTPFKDF